jgi:hypothetical protein
MTFRYSSALRSAMAGGIGFSAALNHGVIDVYTGPQPLSADSPMTGTLLGTFTAEGAAFTPEVQATGTIVITGGSTSVATLTVGTFNIIPDGAVAYNTSTAQTASDLCDAINRNAIYTATVSSSTVTIKPRPGVGDAHNGLAVTSTGSVTATYGGGTMSGGSDPANGLLFTVAASGVVTKTSANWKATGIAAGTAGCFRFRGSVADANWTSTTLSRWDGTCGTSGADMILSNLAFDVGTPETATTCSFTQPAQ